MIRYLDGKVEVESLDSFWLDLGGSDGLFSFDREDFTKLRDAIDQALNTSAEELEASGE